MGIAAMVIGIISAMLAFIPFCGSIAFIPALVGLILGIVDVVSKSKKNEPKAQGIAGIILNALAMIIILVYTLIFVAAAQEAEKEMNAQGIDIQNVAEDLEKAAEEAAKEMEKAALEAAEEAERAEKEAEQAQEEAEGEAQDDAQQGQ